LPRDVTLVVAGPDGRLRGTLPSFAVGTPWWQDLEPVLAARPDVVVLRLLRVEPAPEPPMGGRVAYLVELAGVEPADLDPAVEPDLAARAEEDSRLRLPWARPGGPAADVAWAARQVPLDGDAQQVRSWNLSSIWRLPVARGEVWLKCVPPFFAHEGAVLRALQPRPVPRLLAAEGHRLLLEALPGVDGYGASAAEHRAVLDVVVDLSASTIGRVDELLGAGVPDWRRDAFRAAADALVRRLAPDDDGLRRLLESWDERYDAVQQAGLPDGLFHGDPHPGNARIGVVPPIVFDWGDSGIGSPLLDLASVEDEALVDHVLDRWRRLVPGSDPRRAWDALRPLAVLRGAVVFQRFLDGIEPTERVYHCDDVEPFLRRAVEAAGTS